MSKVIELTPIELRRAGWEGLKKYLGVTEALKFLLQYDKGEGNYTEMRKKLFKDKTVENLIGRMKMKGKIRQS